MKLQMCISPSQYAQALSKQRAFTDAQWLKRCDELAAQQPVLFHEVLTFSRDDVPENICRRLIDYLSVLQFVTKAMSESIAGPVSLSEFQAATQRTMKFFYAISTDDPDHFQRMIKAWYESVVEKSDPMVWAGCVETLRGSGMQEQQLYREITLTLVSIADTYACRLQREFHSVK